jgi:antibiotic biosynthesis monooxygenase (ABM) superfamily enzyme
VIFRFDHYANLRRWVESNVRKAWLDKVEPLVTGDVQVKESTGLEGWFSLPGGPLLAPPRYKMAVATWLAMFPISLALNYWAVPRLRHVPLVPRTLAIAAVLVILMTYAVMPVTTRALRHWLFGRGPGPNEKGIPEPPARP